MANAHPARVANHVTVRQASRAVRAASILVLALSSAACDAALSPIEVGPGCPSEPLRRPEQWSDTPKGQLIDDFEDGDLQLVPTTGRDGAWILGRDESASNLTAEASSSCAARGEWAGHFAGSGFAEWGANWTAVLRQTVNDQATGYDGRGYQAVSFFAALGGTVEGPMLVPIGMTTMDVAWNGGVCTTCMDYYGASVTLTSQWQRYVVPFSRLAQVGYGIPLTPLRPEALVGFIIWPKQEFDIWIDDVRFEP